MSDTLPSAVPASRVRPRLRRVAIVAFVVLLPMAAHSLWDYIEIRRLVAEIEAIRAKGEPVSEREAPMPSKERGAASYYLAGAMLALGSYPSGAIAPIREWLMAESPSREKLDQLTAPLHELVRHSTDALLLADKAAVLPFDGFAAGTEYSYRTAGVSALSELITARTLSLSQAGDADAAADSAVRALQIRRANEARWMVTSGHQIAAVLSLTRPSPPALLRLQLALEAEDQPNRQFENLLRDRARFLETLWRRYYGNDPSSPQYYTLPMRSLSETITRPWRTHNAVELLQFWAVLVESARPGWPERATHGAAIVASHEAERRPSSRPNLNLLNQGTAVAVISFSRAVDPTELIIDRCSRIAVAIERFRRDRNALPAQLADLVPQYLREIPADPYSGQPLLFHRGKDAYTVYSVGPNQQDDQGDLSSELEKVQQQGWGRRLIRGADVGVRVLTLGSR